MRDELILSTPSQVRALAHPLRQRILGLVTDQALTNKQVAEALGQAPGKTHFHFRQLAETGLIELVDQRPVRGVLEKYYRAVARTVRLAPEMGGVAFDGSDDDLAAATLRAASDDFRLASAHFAGAPPRTRITSDRVKLTPAARTRIDAHLDAISAEIRAAHEWQPLPDASDAAELHAVTFAIHPLPDEATNPANPKGLA
jgi:hypothetical protein